MDITSKVEKQNKRRQLIIDKALELTVAQGFEQISIADIAKASQLGPGQIYRCFQDKDEIIENIILNITERRIRDLGFNRHNNNVIATGLARGYPNNMRADELNLLYEVLNVSRNKKINEVIEKSEEKMQKKGQFILQEYYPAASKEEIRAISEVIATLSEGVILRKAKGYSEGVDEDILQRIYLAMMVAIDALFPESEEQSK